MGTRADHREKAEHNQEFLNGIDPTKYPDWVVTVAFCKALHLVEMLFATKGGTHKHSTNHRDRHDALKNLYPAIWLHYRPLYGLSRVARYRVRSVSKQTLEYVLGRLANVNQAISEVMK